MAASVESATLSIQQAERQLTLLGEDFAKICQTRDPAMHEDIRSILAPAVTYKNHFLPKIVETMTAVKTVSEYYTEMSFDDWKESTELLQEDAEKGNSVVLEQQNVHASSLIQPLQKKQSELEQKIQAMPAGGKGQASPYGAVALAATVIGCIAAFVAKINPAISGPCFGVAAAALITAAGFAYLSYGAGGSQEDEDQGKKKKEALAQGLKELSQRLKEFGGTLHALAGFFGNVLHDVDSLKDKELEAHYLNYKAEAPILHSTCSKFIAAVPRMKSQLQDIPSDSNVEETRIDFSGKID